LSQIRRTSLDLVQKLNDFLTKAKKEPSLEETATVNQHRRTQRPWKHERMSHLERTSTHEQTHFFPLVCHYPGDD